MVQDGRPRRQRLQLGQEVAAEVRDLIMSGQLHPHQRLGIDGLAADLDTSTTPVREALFALLGEGLLDFEPRRGFRVASLTLKDVRDLFLVHSMVAGELAGRAAELITDEDLDRITQLQKQLLEAASAARSEEVERLNFEIHRTVNRSAASPKLAWLLKVLLRYVPVRFYGLIPGWVDASAEGHSELIAALRQRNAIAARTIMQDHICSAGNILIAHLEKQEEGEPTRFIVGADVDMKPRKE